MRTLKPFEHHTQRLLIVLSHYLKHYLLIRMIHLAIKLFPLEREFSRVIFSFTIKTEYQNLKDTISKVVTSLNIKTSLLSQYVIRVSRCGPMVKQQYQNGAKF